MEPKQKSELEVFIESVMQPEGQRLCDNIEWVEEKNTHGGTLQEGATFKGHHLRRNTMFPIDGQPTPIQYGIDNVHVFYDLKVFDFQLNRLNVGKQIVP